MLAMLKLKFSPKKIRKRINHSSGMVKGAKKDSSNHSESDVNSPVIWAGLVGCEVNSSDGYKLRSASFLGKYSAGDLEAAASFLRRGKGRDE